MWKSTIDLTVTQYSTASGSLVWIKSLSPKIYWILPVLFTLVWNEFIRQFLETRIDEKKEKKHMRNLGALEKERSKYHEGIRRYNNQKVQQRESEELGLSNSSKSRKIKCIRKKERKLKTNVNGSPILSSVGPLYL